MKKFDEQQLGTILAWLIIYGDLHMMAKVIAQLLKVTKTPKPPRRTFQLAPEYIRTRLAQAISEYVSATDPNLKTFHLQEAYTYVHATLEHQDATRI